MHALVRTALAGLMLGAGVLLVPGSIAAPVAVACSCVAPMPLAEYAGEGTVIFAGTVLAEQGDGVLAQVDTWFSGSGAMPVIEIAGEFGNSAACGLGMRPPVGSRWLVVASRPPAEGPVPELAAGPVSVSICQPFADLATPEGQALLDEAVATFGQGEAGPTVTAIPAPTQAASGASGEGAGPSSEVLVAAGVIVTLLAGAGVLVLVLLAARRRGP